MFWYGELMSLLSTRVTGCCISTGQCLHYRAESNGSKMAGQNTIIDL